ncbi:MAG: phosphate transport system substrate-binding protein [Acidobacteriota bacterium]|jgi:phosphate transport system substrate-binding protein|nr:phosphate transport system substrate-binding protein [Acidobacteriota bacterium]MDT7777800.1 phosphate transport system substrate-binding protein [Acidobacteriota bacterium]
MIRRFLFTLIALSLLTSYAVAQGQESTEGLAMQAARAKMMTVRGRKIAYTKKFDVSSLPHYQPKQKVSGTIRLWGSNYITDGFIGGYWEAAFKKYHPEAKFDFQMKTTLAAVPSLVFGASDIGIGRKITFSEQEMFERYKDRPPVEIELATGSYDVPGWQPGYGIVVHKDNPLAQLTMKQLDGIFGAERAGGWEGTSWRPNWSRGPEGNIRTWGQLGLTGEWADKPINVYGLNLRYHQATEISDTILKGSDKWNEHLRIYANYVSAEGKLERGLNEDLAKDRFGIAYIAAPTVNLGGQGAQPELKVLKIAEKDGGPFVPYSLETLQDRSYPLYSRVYAYVDRAPGKPMDPNVLEFLRFVLSQEGQAEIMRDGKYLPLTAGVVNAQLKKLEDAAK